MSPLGDRTASKRVVNMQLVIGWSCPFIAGCSLVESLYLSKMFTSNILSTFHSLHTQLSTPDTFNSPSPSSSSSSLEAPSRGSSRGSSRESSYEVHIDRKKTFRGVHQGTLMSISWGILLRIALTFQLSPKKKFQNNNEVCWTNRCQEGPALALHFLLKILKIRISLTTCKRLFRISQFDLLWVW